MHKYSKQKFLIRALFIIHIGIFIIFSYYVKAKMRIYFDFSIFQIITGLFLRNIVVYGVWIIFHLGIRVKMH